METPAENSETEWDEEEAPSLAEYLPNACDHSSPEYLQLQEKPPSVPPWIHVLKACRTPRTSDSHDFEFSSVNSTPKSQKSRYSDELCPADKLFYKGQLLPLSSHREYSSEYSLPSRQDSRSSDSSSGSTSQSSHGSSKRGGAAADGPARPLLLPSGIPRAASAQRRSSWQYIARGLLRSPDTSWSSTASLRSQSSSGKPRVPFPQDWRNPPADKEFPSVERREKRRTGWRIWTSIISYGNGCKDPGGVVGGALRSKPRKSNSQIGRFNAVKDQL